MSRSAVFFLVFAAPALSMALGWLGLETLTRNLMGWILLAVGASYPLSLLISYLIRKRPLWGAKGDAAHEEKGDRSFWFILPGLIAGFFAPPLEYLFMPPLLPRFKAMEIAGLILALSGGMLGFWARNVLKKHYSGHLHVISGQSLVTGGPYRWVRHPAYAGFSLIVLGISIGYGSLIGLAVIGLLVLPALNYRIRIEESLLVQQFGDQYQEYRKQARKLIPGIW